MDDQIQQLTEEQIAQGYDTHEPNAKMIALVGMVCILALVGIVLYIQNHWDNLRQDQIYVKVEEPKSASLEELRANENKDLLAKPGIDKAEGKVKLGIALAMDLVAKDAAAGKTFYPAKPYAVKPLEVTPAAGTTPNAAPNASPAQAGAAAPAAAAPAAAKPAEPAKPAGK